MPQILIIDNYDSFTFNLVQQIERLGQPAGIAVSVLRNDLSTADKIFEAKPLGIVISPGPGGPGDAGISGGVVSLCGGKIPILGVCLGMQVIANCYGASVEESGEPVHGKAYEILHSQAGIFEGVPSPTCAARYHSLIVERAGMPASLRVTAETRDGTVMGIQHNEYPLWGVQFHPESFLSAHGDLIIRNFLRNCLHD